MFIFSMVISNDLKYVLNKALDGRTESVNLK